MPSLALGAAETSLLELTAAYAALAAGGVRRAPVLVTSVTSADGARLWTPADTPMRVVSPAAAYLVTHALERVAAEGTARGIRARGLRGAIAGKTGTTDETRDAWFVGYTPDLVVGVWVGHDDGSPTGLTGAAGALPVWVEFMRARTGAKAFPVPDGIVWREVDPATGRLADDRCPERRRVPFLAGTEPTAPCGAHPPRWTRITDDVEDAGRALGRGVEEGGRRLGRWLRDLFR